MHACQICSNCEMWILDPWLVHSWRGSWVINPWRCGRRLLLIRYIVVLNFKHVEIVSFSFCRVLWLFVNRCWKWYHLSFGLGRILFNPKRKWYEAEIIMNLKTLSLTASSLISRYIETTNATKNIKHQYWLKKRYIQSQ